MQSLKFKETGKDITISIGISQRQQGDTLEDVMQRSDQALYQAKSNGRKLVAFN